MDIFIEIILMFPIMQEIYYTHIYPILRKGDLSRKYQEKHMLILYPTRKNTISKKVAEILVINTSIKKKKRKVYSSITG
jgi:hypothetical protein